MEQIIITKHNGSQVPINVRKTATIIQSAEQNINLLGNDVVNITVETTVKQNYGIGDKITVYGRVYKLNRLPEVQKNGANKFKYVLEFEGVQYDLARATYDLTIDTTNNTLQDVQANALTGDLRRFATVLISNANRVFPGKWILGVCPDSETKTLTFGEADNCLSVLQNLCNESNFNIEFEIVQNGDVNTINFKKIGQIFPFTFEYGKGKGLYELERQNVSSSNIVTRLKVYGSDKNITNKYRAQRLCLPGKTKGQSFIEKADAVAKYGIWEATKYFDIHPQRTGKVTALGGTILKFVDNTMFDLNEKEADGKTTKYLLPGISAKIHFNTGNLAGYEFEVQSFDSATKTFTLKQFNDDRDEIFPSAKSTAFQFAINDEYKLLDVALPQNYNDAAENELSEEGDKYYNQNSQPKVQYKLSVTSSFLEKLVESELSVNIFAAGDYIPVRDTDIEVDKSIRIVGFRRNLLKEFEYTLNISDTVATNITNRVISELIDIEKIMQINNLNDPAHARANWRSSREVLDMVFDPDGDYYGDKIKAKSVDTVALSVGAKSMQFGLIGTVFQPNFGGNKNIVGVKGGVLTHYTIDETSPHNWTLANETVTLQSESQAYYIYAKCQRIGEAGTIIFSTQQIKVEQEANYYYFWIGVVNSVDVELHARSISLTYGFTTINGRFVRTGRIVSNDGNTYFDLDTGVFCGNFTFKSGISAETALANTNTIAVNAQNVALQANTGQMDANKKIDGLQIGGDNYYTKNVTLYANKEVSPYENISSRITRTDTGFNFTGVQDALSTVRVGNVITANGWWVVSFEVQSNGEGFAFTVDICDLGNTSFTTAAKQYDWKKIEHAVYVTNYVDGSIYNFVDFSKINEIYFNIRNLKIQRGNRANNINTEIINAKIATSADDTLTLAQQYASNAQQASQQYADTVADAKRQAAEAFATQKIDTAKLDAATDATNKANAAYANAISAAAADAAAKDDLLKTFINKTEKTIDARALDPNTYYPVTFALPITPVKITCYRSLDANFGVPQYSQHAGGFSLFCSWWSNASGWGIIEIDRKIEQFTYAWSNALPVGDIGQIWQASTEFIYVRGGSMYNFLVEGCITEPTLRTSTFEIYSQVIAPVASVTAPVTDRTAVNIRLNDLKAVHDALTYLKTALANNTTVQGGLLGTSLIRLGAQNVNGQWVERAGANGIPGDGNTPRFYAGGTLLDAIARVLNPESATAARYVVTENGDVYAVNVNLQGSISTHFTGARVKLNADSNSLQIYNTQGVIKTEINALEIPDLQTFLTGNSKTVDATKSAGSSVNSVKMPATGANDVQTTAVLELPASSASYNITTPPIVCSISANANGDLPGQDNAYASCSVNAYLVTPTGEVNIGGLSTGVGGYNSDSKTETIPARAFAGMPPGSYYIKLTASSHAVMGDSNATINIASPNNILSGQSTVNKSGIFNNGYNFMQDASHMHYSSPVLEEIRKGNTLCRISESGVEGYGTLLAGTSYNTGGFDLSKLWGTKVHAQQTSIKVAQGKYNVYHSIGHANYTVQLNAATANVVLACTSKATDYFLVEATRNGGYVDCQFDFHIIGKP